MSSNIPANPTYGVYISQLVEYVMYYTQKNGSNNSALFSSVSVGTISLTNFDAYFIVTICVHVYTHMCTCNYTHVHVYPYVYM